jgi:hypothetical protein
MVKALEKLSKSLPKAYQCKKSLREEKGRKGYVIHGKNP